MANYSQWHTERAPTSKKVNSVEEISSLSEKVDALVKLVASRSAPIDLNDIPLSTLIEQNSDAIYVNFISRNNFSKNAYRGNFNHRPFHSNSSNNYGNSYGINHTIIIRTPLILRIIFHNIIKQFGGFTQSNFHKSTTRGGI